MTETKQRDASLLVEATYLLGRLLYKEKTWTRNKCSDHVLIGLAYGLVVGLAVGLHAGFIYGFVAGLTYGVIVGLATGLTYGVIVGLATGLAPGLVFGLAYGLATGLPNPFWFSLAILILGEILYWLAPKDTTAYKKYGLLFVLWRKVISLFDAAIVVVNAWNLTRINYEELLRLVMPLLGYLGLAAIALGVIYLWLKLNAKKHEAIK